MVTLVREKSFFSDDGFFHSMIGPEKLEFTQFIMAKLQKKTKKKKTTFLSPSLSESYL